MSRKTSTVHSPAAISLSQLSTRYHLLIDPTLHTALEVAVLNANEDEPASSLLSRSNPPRTDSARLGEILL